MAGVENPDDAALRGHSFLPLLKNEDLPKECKHEVFAQHATLRSERNNEWKLVMDFSENRRDELYHVWEDPYEKTNLVDEKNSLIESIKRDLEARIRQRMHEINDPLLKKRPS